MTWAALSDELIDKMKHQGFSRDDQLMYVEGLVHATRLLTDGELPADLTRFTTHPQAAEGALRLLAFDYWRVSGHGYAITDFLRHNRTAKQVRESQERSRARTRRWRLHREGDHSMCLPSFCGNAVTNAVTNAVSDVAPSSPLLSPREERERNIKSDPGRDPRRVAPGSPRSALVPEEALTRLQPLLRFGGYTTDQNDDGFGSWFEIDNPLYQVGASITEEKIIDSIYLQLKQLPDHAANRLPTNTDEARDQAPHLESIIESVSLNDGNFLISITADAGLGHRVTQVADYFQRLIGKVSEVSA